VVGRVAVVALREWSFHNGLAAKAAVKKEGGNERRTMIFLGIGVGVVVVLVVDGIVGFKVCKAIWKSTPWGS
jgi:hypothetical protein